MQELLRRSMFWLTVLVAVAAVSTAEAKATELNEKATQQAADKTSQLCGIRWRKAYRVTLKDASSLKATVPLFHLRVLGDLSGRM